MLSFQLDRNGLYSIHWPRTPEGIIALAKAWITCESARNAAIQLKDYTVARIQAKLDTAEATHTNAQTGEAFRTVASGDYRTALTTAKTHLTHALNVLKYKHANHLRELENWGWNVRENKRGGLTVRMPEKDADVRALLKIYITYESTRGPAQLTEPPLATLQALAVDIEDLAQNARSGRVKRTANVQDRTLVTHELLEYLQGAAFTLCLFEFGGKVHPNLGNWGYTVLQVPQSNGEEPPAGDPPV